MQRLLLQIVIYKNRVYGMLSTTNIFKQKFELFLLVTVLFVLYVGNKKNYKSNIFSYLNLFWLKSLY